MQLGKLQEYFKTDSLMRSLLIWMFTLMLFITQIFIKIQTCKLPDANVHYTVYYKDLHLCAFRLNENTYITLLLQPVSCKLQNVT